MNLFKRFLLELQEITLLISRAAIRVFKSPFYLTETFNQMDVIGVGSLTIILLTGFFTGGVLTLQSYPTFESIGAQDRIGYATAYALIRELGPVLTALMVTARVGSAIAAELGTMAVTQQIDAMRALGTDPIRKLVTPRLIALLTMLPLLTVLADLIGLLGGAVVANTLFSFPLDAYFNSVRQGITVEDLLGGIIKPLVFGLLIGAIACHNRRRNRWRRTLDDDRRRAGFDNGYYFGLFFGARAAIRVRRAIEFLIQ